MGQILEDRRASSDTRLNALRAELEGAASRLADKACVYLTGSFGRGEAGTFSDLDVFIVGLGSKEEPALSRLEQICVKADLVHATRKHRFPEFSGDGEYLEHYTIGQLVKTLGAPEDDATNTFTARVLLLLESQPLLDGRGVYQRMIDEVIAAYWRDYADHKDTFIPAFLANDILRLWRTFCVNYEARTATEPDAKKAKRRLKNYKLKHSRLLTCYSALAYLSTEFALRGTVSPEAVRKMVAMTPTRRLQSLTTLPKLASVQPVIGKVLARYEEFLERTNVSEEDLVKQFMDPGQRKSFGESNTLGDLVYDLLSGISGVGEAKEFHRLLLV